MATRSAVMANVDNHQNDDLFDLDLLNAMCVGLDDIPECEIESILDMPSNCEVQEKALRFPEQLRLILDRGHHSSAISWQSDGMSFAIRDHDLFLKEVLPVYFKTSRWKSFQKQLNIYGVKQVKEQTRVYYHKYLVRSNPKLVSRMKREKVWAKYR